ncbi:hypothetical protein [Nocardia brevicatena]|nr:hypothetical protein [Nocardia brevicatena]
MSGPDHIDYRAREALRRCGLLVQRPHGWYHVGTDMAQVFGMPAA